MSLPIAAGGPLNVEIKPIMMVFCWARAGAVASATIAQAASSARFIEFLPGTVVLKGRIIVDRQCCRKNCQACPNATSCLMIFSGIRQPLCGFAAYCSIFTYSKSPGLLSIPTFGGAIQPANLPGSLTDVISDAMNSPSSLDGSQSPLR